MHRLFGANLAIFFFVRVTRTYKSWRGRSSLSLLFERACYWKLRGRVYSGLGFQGLVVPAVYTGFRALFMPWGFGSWCFVDFGVCGLG